MYPTPTGGDGEHPVSPPPPLPPPSHSPSPPRGWVAPQKPCGDTRSGSVEGRGGAPPAQPGWGSDGHSSAPS